MPWFKHNGIRVHVCTRGYRTRRKPVNSAPAQPNPRDQIRKADLAKIHLAKKQLGLEDDDYRAVLKRITGKNSSADLNGAQRLAVLSEFKRLGWREAPRRRERADQRRDPTRHTAPANSRMMAKIAALLGAREWPYVDAMAQKMFSIPRVEFCTPDQLHKIIAALSYDQRRRRQTAAISVLPADALFQTSPAAGDPDCRCSRCGQVCETAPVRVPIPVCHEFPNGAEYRYCGPCVR